MHRARRPVGGFTLIEILVVLVIIGIVISLAVLTIGVTGRDSQIDEEGRRIEGLLMLLHDRALIEGRDFGMRVEPSAYQFEYYDTRKMRWLPLDQEREFRRRRLPNGMSFRLELDSVEVVLKAPDPNAADSGALPTPPQLSIAASGDGTPFRLTLVREGSAASAALSSDSLGKTTLVTSDHPPEKPT
jgi:general secretion pathway protein H